MSESGIVWVIIGSISILPCMYQYTILGTSVRPRAPPEGGAAPHPAGDELKRPRGDLLPGARHPDDDALAPAAVAGFQRLAHHRHIAGAIEGVVGAANLVGAAFCHVDQIGHEIAADLVWSKYWYDALVSSIVSLICGDCVPVCHRLIGCGRRSAVTRSWVRRRSSSTIKHQRATRQQRHRHRPRLFPPTHAAS